ncbi:MAG: tetratricopeptide repeat-containing glycosyltransferase [Rhabdochlamydiaceae bacterium]
MIVKNESAVIERCLGSVKDVIDYWVIVDTGSIDGTQEIIKKYLKNIPGELYQRKWRNFGDNRSEAFNLAKGKGDYILFMDADDTLSFKGKKEFPFLTQDVYTMWRGSESFTYLTPQLAKGNLPWRWVGVVHEYLDCSLPTNRGHLDNVKYVSGDGGARSKGLDKFYEYIKLLKEGLQKDPDNERYVFYLAESYRAVGEKALAIAAYQKRIDMKGWEEEMFISMFEIANLLKDLNFSMSIVEQAYMEAHKFRPHRAEPVYCLATIYNDMGEYFKSYKISRDWLSEYKNHPKDILFNQPWMGDYGLSFTLSISSYYLGQYQESMDHCMYLLEDPNTPSFIKEITKNNIEYVKTKLN